MKQNKTRLLVESGNFLIPEIDRVRKQKASETKTEFGYTVGYTMQSGKLTIARIKSTQPKDHRFTITDGGGLGLEIHPSGSKSWRA